MSAGTALNQPASAATGVGDWAKDTARIHIDKGTSIVPISHSRAWPLHATAQTDEVNLRAVNSAHPTGSHSDPQAIHWLEPGARPERRNKARRESENQLDEREVVHELVRAHEHAVVGDELSIFEVSVPSCGPLPMNSRNSLNGHIVVSAFSIS